MKNTCGWPAATEPPQRGSGLCVVQERLLHARLRVGRRSSKERDRRAHPHPLANRAPDGNHEHETGCRLADMEQKERSLWPIVYRDGTVLYRSTREGSCRRCATQMAAAVAATSPANPTSSTHRCPLFDFQRPRPKCDKCLCGGRVGGRGASIQTGRPTRASACPDVVSAHVGLPGCPPARRSVVRRHGVRSLCLE